VKGGKYRESPILHNKKRWDPDQKLVRETLNKKCAFKDFPVPTMTILVSSVKNERND